MDALIDILIGYGYWGMFVATLLAGSFFPFSSEVVMVALNAAGLNGWQLIIYGTMGNVLGGIFNYCVGRLGKMEWIEKYLHVKKRGSTVPSVSWAGTEYDGLLLFPADIGFCHHNSTRTHARQHSPLAHQRYTRQISSLRSINLWSEFPRVITKL